MARARGARVGQISLNSLVDGGFEPQSPLSGPHHPHPPKTHRVGRFLFAPAHRPAPPRPPRTFTSAHPDPPEPRIAPTAHTDQLHPSHTTTAHLTQRRPADDRPRYPATNSHPTHRSGEPETRAFSWRGSACPHVYTQKRDRSLSRRQIVLSRGWHWESVASVGQYAPSCRDPPVAQIARHPRR
jgi:hypothetical protein